MSTIEGSYRFDYDMYVRANRLHRNKTMSMWLLHAVFFRAAPFTFFLLAAGNAWSTFRGDRDWLGWAGYNWFELVAAIVLLALPLLGLRVRYRNALPSHLRGEANRVRFSEDEVVAEMTGLGQSTLQWEAFCRRVIGDSLILLYLSKGRFIFVPKCAFSDSDWTALQQLVEQKIGAHPC